MKEADKPSVEDVDATPLNAWHYLLLLVPYAGLLVPSLYARVDPRVGGVPFFYAYQFAWIFLSAGLTAVVYRSITRGKR